MKHALGAFAHVLQWFEVNRHQPVLHPEKLIAKCLANLRWKLPQIVPAAANEQKWASFPFRQLYQYLSKSNSRLQVEIYGNV